MNSPIVFSSPVTVSIGSASVTASYAGLVGVGLFQINFTVPPLADGDYPIAIQTGGKSSQSGMILPCSLVICAARELVSIWWRIIHSHPTCCV